MNVRYLEGVIVFNCSEARAYISSPLSDRNVLETSLISRISAISWFQSNVDIFSLGKGM